MRKKLEVLHSNNQLGPFPVQKLKRVDRPTTLITDTIQRIDAREIAMVRAARGLYGPAVQKAMQVLLPPLKYPLSAAQNNIVEQLGNIIDNEVAATKAPIPSDPLVLSRHIKRLGYYLKADAMGICELPKSAIYSYDSTGNPINFNYKYAIVVVTRKEEETIKASNGHDWISDSISFQAYQRCALIAVTMANYIRRLGYPALAQHEALHHTRYQVLIPPLMLWAGIGEVSRAGIILNPFLGLATKGAAVLTDLPLKPDKPIDFGLQKFCQDCKICAEHCPSRAISSGDKIMYNGYLTWKLDEERCASYCFINKHGTICNTCVKVCPWSNPYKWSHNLVRWMVQRSSLARWVAIWSSRMSKPEKPDESMKWWFDLKYEDGVLKKDNDVNV